MKALIIEDNRFKFQDAIEVLKRHGITEYVHFDNCDEALDFIYEPDNIENIDLIILDLNFFMSRGLIGERCRMPTPDAGGRFIWQMLQNEMTTPVIVYSSEEDYMNVVHNYLFVSLSEYARGYENGPLPMTYSQIQRQYDEDIAERRKKLLDLTFIVGHAHEELELDFFIKEFLRSVQSED